MHSISKDSPLELHLYLDIDARKSNMTWTRD